MKFMKKYFNAFCVCERKFKQRCSRNENLQELSIAHTAMFFVGSIWKWGLCVDDLTHIICTNSAESYGLVHVVSEEIF